MVRHLPAQIGRFHINGSGYAYQPFMNIMSKRCSYHTLSHKHQATIYTISPAFWYLSLILHPLNNLNIDSKAVKCLAALLIQPLVPPLTLGSGLMLTCRNFSSSTHWTNTWKLLGLQGDMGWRVIRLDALHLSL